MFSKNFVMLFSLTKLYQIQRRCAWHDWTVDHTCSCRRWWHPPLGRQLCSSLSTGAGLYHANSRMSMHIALYQFNSYFL